MDKVRSCREKGLGFMRYKRELSIRSLFPAASRRLLSRTSKPFRCASRREAPLSLTLAVTGDKPRKPAVPSRPGALHAGNEAGQRQQI